MSKNYTPDEAAQILMEGTRQRVERIAKSLKDLRDRELAKAIIPRHKHNTGTTSSAGIEDVPPGKINPPGKDDVLKSKPEETTAPGEETTMVKEELCKQCGKSHEMDKACGMDKAVLSDAKGNIKDNSEHPDSVLPDDKKSKKVDTSDGSGGDIVKKAAQPPMAKPPSGKNMGTHVPVSKEVKEMVVHGTSKPVTPPKGADYDAKQKGTTSSYVRKEELDKGALNPQAKQHMMAAAGGPAPAAPAAPVKLPSPAEHAARAQSFSAFTPAAGTTGHAMKKPGIFGRLGKSESLEKAGPTRSLTPLPKLKAPGTALAPATGGGVARTEVPLGGMGPPSTVGGTNTMASPSRNVLGAPKPTLPQSPVLTKRPALKLPGAGLKTAGASYDNTEGDQTALAPPRPTAQIPTKGDSPGGKAVQALAQPKPAASAGPTNTSQWTDKMKPKV